MRNRQLFLVTMGFALSFSVWGLISGLASFLILAAALWRRPRLGLPG